MANPTLPTEGTVTWTNDANNWRAQDVHWLQSRALMRFADVETDAALADETHEEDGSVAYDTTSKEAKLYNGTEWQNIAAARSLDVAGGVGGTGNITFSHSGSLAITLASNGDVTIGNLTVTTGAASTFTCSTSLTVNGITLSVAAGDLQVSADLDVSGTVAATGDVTGTNLTASTAVQGSTVTATTSSSLAAASADSLTATGTVQGATVLGTSYVSTGASNLRLTGNKLQQGTTTDKYIDLDNWELNDGSTNAATIAGVVYGPTEPVGDYPDGTIWIQTP
jgi:hypothetical protein